jgi:hypothetical protein
MIKTKKIKFTQRQIFLIMITTLYKKIKIWMGVFIIGVLITINNIIINNNTITIREWISIWLIIFTIIYFIARLIYIWKFTTNKENNIIFHERYYEIEHERINTIFNKDIDIQSIININYIIKIELIKENYLLYIGSDQFICIPFDAFENDLDKQRFECNIIKRIQKK